MQDTLERLVPQAVTDDDLAQSLTLHLHIERYHFAQQHLRSGRVLDIACGVGYGSEILAQRENVQVLGVDVSADAIEYAKNSVDIPNIEFFQESAFSFLERHTESFDTIVSLETIEHLAEPQKFAELLTSALKPSGYLVVSAPVTPSVDANPHHLHDFTEQSLRDTFLSLGLNEKDSLLQIQPFSPIHVLSKKEQRFAEIRPNLLRYYYRNPQSLLKRIYSTIRYGFTNRYLTLLLKKGES